MPVDFPREIALKILYDINEKDAYSNITINKYLERDDLKSLDRSFVTELVYGTEKWKLKIDWIIQQFSNIKLKKISPWLLNVLRLGTYQIIFMSKVPESAACNESVELAKKYGHKASSGFVNGVIRNIARSKNNIKYPDRNIDFAEYLSIMYSHPKPMTEKFLKLFGEEFTESLLKANNEIPVMTARANTLKITPEQLVECFLKEGIEAHKGKFAIEAVILNNPSSIAKFDSFKKGLFQIQDESSMLVAQCSGS